MPISRLQPLSSDIGWFRARVLRWFAEHGRTFPWREGGLGSYELVVAELLLQRTTANAVARFIPRFLERYPSWDRLDTADVKELEEQLRPIGLWRRRARALKELASAMVAANQIFPRERAAVEALPGVGQYMASAVLLLVHREPAPLLDSNMARVLERFFGPRGMADIRYDPWLQGLAMAVVACGEPVAVNWGVLDLAATVCRPRRPNCSECDLHPRCRFLTTSSGRSRP
jgi:A/G-specific adenine glycosylase